jgi:hypothetical protein
VNPVVSLSISPAAHSISAGGKAQFNAVVSGTTNTAVSWSLSPALGTVLNGLYTAPTSVSAPTTVQVIATSMADPTRLAVGTVQINPPAPPSSAAIVLPIEVYGANGTTRAVDFTLSSTQLPSASRLFLQVHGLSSENEASIQINNSNWIPLNETNLQLLPLEKAYGGIGGGFGTVRGRLNLQSGWLVVGTNTIRFRFNQTDGFSHGFRILRFNVENSMAQGLLPASTFVDDNPSTWTAPLPDATSISQGRFLWYNAQLSTPLASSIRAKCTDCHAQDGRDLKYFNYSNLVIRTRAQFHGLTSTQGDQIASYIRSLNVPSPGRPWNPPYQPGTGTDSRPISEWSAGGGLSAVLDDDRDSLKAIFPYGYDASRIMPTGNLSAREIPVALQLPDWNHWLPQVHPKDGFPSTFDSSAWNQYYLRLRSGLQPGSVASLLGQRDVLSLWAARRSEFLVPLRPTTSTWPESTARNHYSGLLWQMVKEWELNQEFQLEGLARSWFGPQADDRAWISGTSFATSPNMVQIPRGNTGLMNNRPTTHTYMAFAWYHLQLVLNNSNKRQDGTTPIDWPYVYGFLMNMGDMSPQVGVHTIWWTKSMQILENGIGPEVAGRGWSYHIAGIPNMAHPGLGSSMNSLTASDRNALARIFLQVWIGKARSFTPSQWYALQTKSTESISSVVPFVDNMPSRVYWMLLTFRTWGVDPAVLRDGADWAQLMWPNIGWRLLLGI